MESSASRSPLPIPQFDIQIEAPDLSRWIAGNTGISGFTTRESGKPGPHVALLSLMHGNELAGAIVLDRLLRAGIRPLRGRLTIGFANLAAFGRFDPRQPTASRFIDEDLNRVWDAALLDGPRCSAELGRAREMRPLIETVDILLDLHSMLWPSEPLILCGASPQGRALALSIGQPELTVADHGHLNGPRLIDYAPFIAPATKKAAVLVESGQHWQPETVAMTAGCVSKLLHALRMVEDLSALPVVPPGRPARFAEVTDVVTATTSRFAFVQPFRGGDIVPRANTLLALDGTTEIRTPYDGCLLVMPSLRPSRGHTAVRLARIS